MPKILALGGFSGGTVANNTTFSGNVAIQGTLDVTGVATFTTTVTGSGNIMAGAAFALGFTGRAQFKSSADGRLEAYATDGSTLLTSFQVGGGAAGTPGVQLGSLASGGFGLYRNGTELGVEVVSQSVPICFISSLTTYHVGVRSDAFIGWSSTTDPVAAHDTSFRRVSAGLSAAAADTATALAGFQPAQSANGATLQILGISEQLTLSTSGTTTDTTANLLPAGAIILTVLGRITTTITTATSWQIGDPTTAGRFTPANSTMTANTTDIGRVHITTGIASATTGVYQSAAAKVRITTVGTPGAGVIRLTSFYILLTPPTS